MKDKISTEKQNGNCAKPLLCDVYREALRLFEGTDQYRPAMMQPFFQGEFVIATDAHKLICFEKRLLKTIDFESHEKAPNALAIIPDENFEILDFKTDFLREKVDELRKISKGKYLILDGKCPDCNGDGWVEYTFEDHKGTDHTTEGDCPTCETQSVFRRITNIETGKKIDEFREVLKMDESYIDVDQFEKMVKAAEILNIDEIKLTNRKSKTSIHKFIVGECTIVLMPLHSVEENDIVLNIA